MWSNINTSKTKIKSLIILIILCSLISWFISSYLLLKFNKYNSNSKEIWVEQFQEVTKIITNEKITNIINLENEITNLVKKASPSVVSIIIKKDLILYRSDPWWFFYSQEKISNRKIWWWTGFFVTKEWIIITNKHVVNDPKSTYTIITNDNKEFDAKILSLSKNNDIAILQIISDKNTFKPLSFIKTKKKVKIWQFSIAIWNALSEFQNSVSLWIVSWKNRSIKNWNNILWELIQTDTAINPWNSWWPLINLEWKVMWINTAIIQWYQWIWFSISMTEEKLNYILSSIEKSWEIKTPFIWINYIAITPWIKDEFELKSNYGLYIIDEEWGIIPWSPADKIWIKPWDILLSANWTKLNKSNDLNILVQNKIPWNIIKLKVLKKDLIIKDYDLVLGEK